MTLASKLCKKWMQLRMQQSNATDTASSQFCASLLGPTSCTAGKYIDLKSKSCKQCESNTYQTEYRFPGSGCKSCEEAARKCAPGTYLHGCGGASQGKCVSCTPVALPASDVFGTPKGTPGWTSNGGLDKDKCRFQGYIAYRDQSCGGVVTNLGQHPIAGALTTRDECLDACSARDDCNGVQFLNHPGICSLLGGSPAQNGGDHHAGLTCWRRRRE